MAECNRYLEQLASDDYEELRAAAFAAGEEKCVEAVPRLAQLLETKHLGVQEAADQALRRIGGAETVRAVIPLLRCDDAPARNLGMDILREVGVQDISALIELVKDEDPDIRIFASDILGSTHNSMCIQPLCNALLKDPEVNVRYQAAVSLGELGFPDAATCLNKAMEDEEWVQYSVIEALTKLGDASSINPLVKAMDHSSDLVRSMIIDALGEMGNVKAVGILLSRLETSPAALRNKIVKAVVNILGGKSLTLLSPNERERFRVYALAALEDEDEDVQDAAIEGLSFVGGDPASRGILRIAAALDPERHAERLDSIIGHLANVGLTDGLREGLRGEPGTALVAVETLTRVGTQDAADAVMEVFWDSDRTVQREIVSCLSKTCGEGCKDFFMDVLERHDDAKVVKSALRFLGKKLRLPEAGPKMFDLLDHQYDDVKEAALDACIAVGGEDMTERFREMFRSPEPIHRLMAVYALGNLGAEQHMDILREALSDEIPDIRKVALEAVSSTCPADVEQWLEFVVPGLQDENKDVRLTVIELMGGCHDAAVLPHLLKALEDSDDWVRIRALEALGSQKAKEAVPVIVEFLEQPNRLLVMKAVEALGAIGGTAAFRSLLELSNSEDPELVDAAESAVARIQEEQDVEE